MKKLFVIAFLFPIFFSCCTKTGDKPTPIAVYTIGNGTSCASTVVSGRYVADTALTAANTVTVNIDVTLAGPYWITTNTVNNISFSAISNFADTGFQTAVLIGTGTPLTTDSANFTITALTGLGGSCTFSVGTVKGTPPHYYITCFLNGVYRNFSDSAGATNSSIPGGSGAAGLDIRGFDTVLNSSSKVEFGVSSAVGVGPGTYSDTSLVNTYFNFTDNAGQLWAVKTSAQPSFTTIVTTVSATSVQGSFSGTIKSKQGVGTDSIAVTNGLFSIPVN